MRKIRKMLALVLVGALALTMGFATTAVSFAAGSNTITVTGTVKDETYKAYKMMDLVVDNIDTPSAYKYTVDDSWKDFFTTGYGKDYVTIDANDGHITWKDGMNTDAKMILLAQEAAKYSASLSEDKKVVADDSKTVTFSEMENGYYLITSTLGTKAMIDSTPTSPAQTINEKNPEDTIKKEVQEDSTEAWGDKNDAQIGDTVNYKSTATIQPYTRNVYIHDTMDTGLDYQGDVKIDGLTQGTDYVVLSTPQTGDTFTIRITDTYIAGLTEATTLTLTYTAKVNDKAVVKDDNGVAIVDQNNKTKITYGDKQSVEDKTITTTHKFSVFKHAKDSTANLADAVFQLKKDGTVIKLTKIDDNNYRVDPSGSESTFTTVASGDIVIWGVDSDNDYTLVETQAPAGYNKLDKDVSVTVDAGNATRIDVENKTGSELPSTGGMGTTILYIIGAILVVGAGILLVARRRMDARD